jgi:hypothetical protein
VQTFRCPPSHAIQAAEYFKEIFSTDFKEAIEGSATFPEDDAEVWELLVQWPYQGELLPFRKPAIGTKLKSEEVNPCTVRLKLCSERRSMGRVPSKIWQWTPSSHFKELWRWERMRPPPIRACAFHNHPSAILHSIVQVASSSLLMRGEKGTAARQCTVHVANCHFETQSKL